MFLRVLWGSLRHQSLRLAAAAAAMFLGSSLISALLNLSYDAGSKAGRELRAYGANVLLLPRERTGPAPRGLEALGMAVEGDGIPEDSLAALEGLDDVVGYAPYLYSVVEVAGQPAVAAGVDFERVRGISPWWKVDGRWPDRPSEALLGEKAALSLDLGRNDRLSLRYGESTAVVMITGIVETGGSEDSQVFAPLPLIQRLSGREGQVGLVQLSALAQGGSLADIRAEIEKRLPDIQVRTLDQFARGDEIVLGRMRLLLALVAGLVLIVAALSVGNTLATEVLFRLSEIGLMKAIGAMRRKVAAIFMTEGACIGLVGGVVGYFAGLGAAALIGRQVFDASLAPSGLAFPVTLAVAMGVVTLASLWPVQRALAVEPSVTLRGE